MDYEDDYRRSSRRSSRSGGGGDRGSSRGYDRDGYDRGASDPRSLRRNNSASASRSSGGRSTRGLGAERMSSTRGGGVGSSRRGIGSSSSSSSPPRRKKKPGASAAGADDLLEAKLQAKKKKERGGGGSSSRAEDALEAKIRKKNAAAAGNSTSKSRRARGGDWEEEKVEEGLSVYSDDERAVSGPAHGRGAVSSGVPVTGEAGGGGDPNALFTRGGGDVRNRPPQNPGAGQLDPLREAELEKEKNKKQVNQRYADLHETGQWGGLNKWEKYGICLLTLGAIATAVVLGLKFGRPGGDKTPEPTPRPTKFPSASPSTSPTLAPTDVNHREETGLDMMIASSPKLALPQTIVALKSKAPADMTPQELAATYVLYDDPLEIPARDPRFLERYALVVFYYQNGGCTGDWINKFNWMNGRDHCKNDGADEWFGVVCDLKGRVIEVNLSKNHVTGVVPAEFGGLLELSSLDLSNNAMEGQVPHEALSMPKMYTIQLNNNKLEGEFPFEQVKEGATILDNLWIQENTDLRGRITEAYCGMNSITLDCDNFDPQPTYPAEDPDDTGYTTFQQNCLDELGGAGLFKEYTCNFDDPIPFVRPDNAPVHPSTENCGAGSVFKRRRQHNMDR